MMLIEPLREERPFLRLLPAVWVRGEAWISGLCGSFFYIILLVCVLRWPQLRSAGVGVMTLLGLLLSLALLYAGSVVPRYLAATGRRGPWLAAAGRFRRNRSAVVGAILLITLCCVSLLAPVLAPSDPAAQNPVTGSYLPPSADHLMGTDKFGRDILSRTVFGARVSLSVALTAVAIAAVLGLLLGAFSGYIGGFTDDVIMRVVDGLLAFPRLLLVLTILAFFVHSTWLLVLLLGATGWMSAARLVRAEVVRLRESEFVQAAVSAGASRRRVVLRHLVPNAFGPLIITATLRIGAIIMLEAYLSFLGLGVGPPAPSWGAMVFEGRDVLLSAWWVSTFPGLSIVLAVVACNLMGDGLRDAADVRG